MVCLCFMLFQLSLIFGKFRNLFNIFDEQSFFATIICRAVRFVSFLHQSSSRYMIQLPHN